MRWINGLLYGQEIEVPHVMRVNLLTVRRLEE
jgi:hypothetical protein